MDFQAALTRLQQADEKGDLLGSLKAQKSIIIAALADPDFDPKRLQVMSNLLRVTADIIKQEGLSREVSDSDKSEMTDEDAIRRVLGVGGIGAKN